MDPLAATTSVYGDENPETPIRYAPSLLVHRKKPVLFGRLFQWQGFILTAFCAVLLLPSAALAHGDLHEQIEEVSRQLEQGPTAELYLRRGELHRAHREYAAALADYDRVEALDAKFEAVQLARGRTLLEAGEYMDAEKALTRFLEHHPEHGDAFLYRARAALALKQFDQSVADYDRAIGLSPMPLPDHYLERSGAWKSAGQPAKALEGLEQGIAKLGPLVTLSLAAIDLEVSLERFDAALLRLDRLMAGIQRKERWLERKAVILEKAGRKADSKQAYEEALQAVNALPLHLRGTRATQETEKRIRQALATFTDVNL